MKNNTHSSVEQIVLVENIKVGEFVRKIKVCVSCKGDGATDSSPCGDCATLGYHATDKTFKRSTYDKSSKRYSLNDCDDVCREVFVKKGTRLFVGFSY